MTESKYILAGALDTTYRHKPGLPATTSLVSNSNYMNKIFIPVVID